MVTRLESVMAAAFLGLLCAACGHARIVKRHQTGGVLALEGARNKAMEDANVQMSQHCGGAYTIVEEGEHVVGSDTVAGEETYVAEEDTVVTEGGQSTRDAVEWRIVYECGQAAPPPAMAPTIPPGPAPQPVPPVAAPPDPGTLAPPPPAPQPTP